MFIDCEKSIAHVGGGALLYHLDLECEAHGNKFAVAGTNASTGIGGFTIGGGWGYLSRKHGMAVDNLVEAEVVTAGGKLHVVNDKNEPDLFWAIKGAGHNYGVCTKFVFKLHEVNTAFSGLIIRPFSAAAHVLKSYVNHYYGSKPADLEDVSSVVLAYGPPGPDDVQHQVAMTFCIWVGKGTEADARTALADLLEDTEGPVLANTVASIPYATGLQMMLEPIQAPGLWIEKAMFIEGRLPESVQEVLIESFAKAPTKGCSIVVHPIGGKIGELPSDATAFPHRIKSGSWVIMVGRADNEADYQKLENWMKEEYPKLEPFKAGVFVNEIGSWWNESAQADDSAVKELVASKKDYWGGNLDRLQKLKEKYDPGNLFKNHSKSLMSKN